MSLNPGQFNQTRFLALIEMTTVIRNFPGDIPQAAHAWFTLVKQL